jgi:XTP/dITP diphosphohydrolase
LEEAQEVLETIEAGEVGDALEDELGDVLLQVVFHAQLAADDDRFDVEGVGAAIIAKLVRRHPHVFSDTIVSGADEVVTNWNAIKAEEKKLRSRS